jgi:hypothetical protein
MVGESALFNRATPFIRWIDGFEPYCNEMTFDRGSPSCYSCVRFAAFMDQSRGGIVLSTKCRRTASIAQFRRFLVFMLRCVIRPGGSPWPRLRDWGNGKQANGMSAGG